MDGEKLMYSDDRKIFDLVKQFRLSIEKARDAEYFSNDFIFNRFPRACCGDTCYILAEYLKSKGIETIYVCGDFNGGTHAWLVVKDSRVKIPKQQLFKLPDEMVEIFNSYSNGAYSKPIDITRYNENDLKGGLIIDITADQFGERNVFVGYMDDFHSKYEFQFANDYVILKGTRLIDIYHKIIYYIDE